MPRLLLPLLLVALAVGPLRADEPKVIRVGIVGLDTSHVVAFTQLLNNPKNTGDLAGIKVVAAYPGGSPDIPASRDRLAGFTKTLQEKHGIEIVDSIAALLPKVDAVLLESVDGRKHLEQLRPIVAAGKPCFIDKPLAGSLADIVRIYDLAAKHKVPVFSSSSLRFNPGVAGLRDNAKVGKVLGCLVYSPCALEPHHPDLFWYGIHGGEIVYTLMGPGCQSLVRTHTEDADVVTGRWRDGRTATLYGMRKGKLDYGATVFGTAGIGTTTGAGSYEPLVVEIARFFKTGKAPVSPEETIELYTFLETADASKRADGAPVTLQSVLDRARAEASRE